MKKKVDPLNRRNITKEERKKEKRKEETNGALYVQTLQSLPASLEINWGTAGEVSQRTDNAVSREKESSMEKKKRSHEDVVNEADTEADEHTDNDF